METILSRVLVALLLYTGGADPAPQDGTAITYVKPLAEEARAPPGPAWESRIENLPLIIGGLNDDIKPVEEPESVSSDSPGEFSTPTIQRVTREDATTSSYETDTTTSTERVSDEPAEPTEPNEVKLRFPSPRFTSKLSYFKKSSSGSVVTNLVEKTGKRKFRSRCRCEKIWNCPKLQITVPRCPEEYFLCCF